MSLQNIVIDLPSQTAQDFKDICNLAPGANQAVINLSNFLRRLAGGESYGEVTVNVGAVQASATITSTGAATAAQTMTLCNVTLTAVASDPEENEFVVSGTVGTQAANIAECINSSSDLAGLVTASANLGVVTVTAVLPGLGGNGLQIADVDLANVAVAAFSGGDDGTQYVMDLS